MRILIALTYYRPHYSGLTIYAEREARALAARGHQVTVLTSRYSPDLPPYEIRDGIEVIRPKVWFHLSKGVIMPSIPIWAWRLARKADVIQLHVPQLDAAPISMIAKLLKKPVILTYHCDLQLPDGLVHKLANWGSNLANEITSRAADLIVTNTRDNAENSPFLRRFNHKLVPLYPPVELEPISQAELSEFKHKHKIQPSQRIIAMVARLAAEKGVEHLVEALPVVLEHFPTARVLFVGPYQNVVGEDRYARRIMPMVDQLGEHWTFLGTVSPADLAALFMTSEVVVLPSLNSTESYGIVQVESMISGTPVIASDLPGVRVPILETGSGLIVPPGSTAELADALIQILEKPDQFRGHPEDLIRQSTPQAVAEQYERLFELSLNRDRLKKELQRKARGSSEN